MKKLLLIIVLVVIGSQLSIINCSAQGTIISFYTIPASPTIHDNVKVVANVSFTSGDCAISDQGHGTIGLQTDAYAHHCLGVLTVICTTTDTFNLGMLPAGSHTFNLTLTSGGGPAPCTPGIVADDMDSFIFTVDQGVGINPTESDHFAVYPNPATTEISIQLAAMSKKPVANICNALGQQVIQTTLNDKRSTINIETLSPGLYYLTITDDKHTLSEKILKK